jgi:hypothetical protein
MMKKDSMDKSNQGIMYLSGGYLSLSYYVLPAPHHIQPRVVRNAGKVLDLL